jgi:cysteine desulfurase
MIAGTKCKHSGIKHSGIKHSGIKHSGIKHSGIAIEGLRAQIAQENMSERIYLDWNATAPLRPQAREALTAAFDVVGNPSSVHGEGRVARRLLEEARGQVAALVGARPSDVFFTGSGTEANALALSPAAETQGDGRSCDRLLMSSIEHSSVRAGARFPRAAIEDLPVDADGRVDFAVLQRRLSESSGIGRTLVSIMLANNETGVLQPIAAAAEIVHAAGGLLHVDAVQAAGRIAVDMAALGVDLLTVSAHKLGGPKGVGALVRCSDGLHISDPLIKGGGQERGMRAGTENVAGIAAFGAAAAAAQRDLEADTARVVALRDRLESGLKAIAPDAVVFGAGVERLPNTTAFATAGMKAETAVIAFDLEGIAVSSGAACSSGKVQPSHVLAAMGVPPELLRGAVRVSLGWTTTESDVEGFLRAWRKVSGALSKEQRGLAA